MCVDVVLGEGITGWVIANQKPFCNTDPRLDFPPAVAEHFQNYRTLASFPLLKQEQLYGAVTLYSSTLSEYNAEQQKLLQECAAILTNMLSLQPSSHFDAGEDSFEQTLGIGNPSPAGFEESDVEFEMTH